MAEKLEKLYSRLSSMAVFRGVLQDEVFSLLLRYCGGGIKVKKSTRTRLSSLRFISGEET